MPDAAGVEMAGYTPGSMFERVGGEAFFEALVGRFYAAVEQDPALRSMYPPDLSPSREHLTWFLVQYWGGPQTFSARRGPPALRMRHVPFAIGQVERDAWMRHMTDAVRSSGISPEDQADMLAYFEMASTHMINRPV